MEALGTRLSRLMENPPVFPISFIHITVFEMFSEVVCISTNGLAKDSTWKRNNVERIACKRCNPDEFMKRRFESTEVFNDCLN